MNNALILDMQGNRINFDVISGKEVKLTKAGNIKRTPNNNTEDRWVDPIRDMADIRKVKLYLQSKVDAAAGSRYEKNYARNKMLFICAINWGLRVSDLLSITWDYVFEDDMKTFRVHKGKIEKKTGKKRQLYFNNNVQNAIMEYITKYNVQIEPNGYVFESDKKDKYGNKKPITDTAAGNIIKEACKECGIAGDYYTHSYRKTFAYQLYMALENKHDPLALPKVQKFLNHRNQSDTLRYLGLNYKAEKEMSDMLCL